MLTHFFRYTYSDSINFIFFSVSRTSQSGIMDWYVKERVPRTFADSEIILDQYVSSQLFLPETPEPEIKLKNIQKFKYLYFSLLFTSLIVLIYEIIHYQIKKSIMISDSRIRTFRIRKREKGIKGLISDLRRKLFNPVVIL